MDEIICFCKNISKKTIEAAIEKGATTYLEVREATGAGSGSECRELNPTGRCCSTEIQAILDNHRSGSSSTGCCCCTCG